MNFELLKWADQNSISLNTINAADKLCNKIEQLKSDKPYCCSQTNE